MPVPGLTLKEFTHTMVWGPAECRGLLSVTAVVVSPRVAADGFAKYRCSWPSHRRPDRTTCSPSCSASTSPTSHSITSPGSRSSNFRRPAHFQDPEALAPRRP